MPKKTPTRTCIACGASADKRELVRIVRTPDLRVKVDAGGKQAGRGAYICRDEACFERVRGKRLLSSKLRCKVGAEDMERLEDEFRAVCAKAG